MSELTEKQDAILRFCMDHLKASYPSIRQIAKAFNLAPTTVLDHLLALERKGFFLRNRKLKS